VVEIRTAHTAELDAASLDAARALLYATFDDMTESDWEHGLGGMHAMAWEGTDLVAHASMVQRRLVHQGRALRSGYVEAVAVRADRRRQGLGDAVMAPLELVARRAYDIAALASTEEAMPFYAARGWMLWRGPTSALTPTGIERTEDDDGCVYVLPLSTTLDLDGELTCDWRDGDVW
jgi:aminoglycoside 2'-N-acetyltransferase I